MSAHPFLASSPGTTALPFTLAEALDAGISRRQLRAGGWRRIGHGLYISAEAPMDDLVLLTAIRKRLPGDAIFSGLTAGWLHGLDLPACNPIEVTLGYQQPVAARAGLRVRRSTVADDDKCSRQGLPVTSAIRTATDIGRWLPLTQAVIGLDMALHAKLVALDELWSVAKTLTGWPGVARLRRALELAEPKTESPMETRLRLKLVLAGLPRPLAQVEIYDSEGNFIARPDFLYPDQKLAIEYDGSHHRDNWAADIRRQNRLLEEGYRVLRFTGADFEEGADTVVAQVVAARMGLHGATSREPNA